jgi:hypothetical protein
MKIKTAAILFITTALALSALLVPAQAATQSTSSSSSELVYVSLELPQTSDQLLTIFENSSVQPLGFRHEQEFVGEYFVQSSKTLAQNVAEYETIVRSDFGASPRVVGVYVGKVQAEVAQSLLASRIRPNPLSAAKASPGLISWAKSVAAHRTSPKISSQNASTSTALDQTNLPSTSIWAPNSYSGQAYQTGTYSKFYSVFDWSWSNHSPHNFASGWGFEYDWSLYNYNLQWTRPNCVYDNDTKFWASRWPEILAWSMWVNGTALNGSDNYGAYLDGNDFGDQCSRLGFAVGIGYPLNLPAHPSIQVVITAQKGNLASSLYEIQAQTTQNNCYGIMPDSNCMGLTANYITYPGPGAGFHRIVDVAWSWRAPGCYRHVSSGTASKVC